MPRKGVDYYKAKLEELALKEKAGAAREALRVHREAMRKRK